MLGFIHLGSAVGYYQTQLKEPDNPDDSLSLLHKGYAGLGIFPSCALFALVITGFKVAPSPPFTEADLLCVNFPGAFLAAVEAEAVCSLQITIGNPPATYREASPRGPSSSCIAQQGVSQLALISPPK